MAIEVHEAKEQPVARATFPANGVMATRGMGGDNNGTFIVVSKPK